MSVIEEIYEKLEIDAETTRSNRELEISIKEIARRLDGTDQQKQEYLKGLIFEASGCGQKDGFWSGFRFAVVMMAECFV